MIYENLRYLFFLIILTVPYLVVGQDFYIGKTVLLYHYFHQTYKDWLFKIANRKDLTQEHFLLSSYNYTIEDFSMINKKKELGI